MADATIKQEKFAIKFVELGNASEAYRQSYDAENMTNESIAVAASRLLDNAKVALIVEKLREKALQRHMVTVDSITDELEEARNLASSVSQPSAMISASMGKAKLHGLTDKPADTNINIE
jgi:phage terminase small subunit